MKDSFGLLTLLINYLTSRVLDLESAYKIRQLLRFWYVELFWRERPMRNRDRLVGELVSTIVQKPYVTVLYKRVTAEAVNRVFQ